MSDLKNENITISGEYFSLLPNGISFFLYENLKYKMLFMNDASQHIFGENSEKMADQIAEGTLSILHPEDRDKLKLIMYKASVSGGIFREIVRLQLNDAYKWFAVAINSEPRLGGASVVCFVFADVNAQISRQKNLDTAYTKLMDVVNNMPGGVAAFDTLNNRILVTSYISQGLCRLLKGTEQQIRDRFAMNPISCIHPDDKEKVVRIMEDALRNLSDFHLSMRLHTLDDQYISVACTGTIETIENQRSIYVAVIESSIDAQLLALEKRILDRFVNNQYDSIYYVDGREDQYQMLSSRGSSMIPQNGCGYEEMVRKIAEKYVLPENQELIQQQMSLKSVTEQLSKQEEIEYFCTIQNGSGKQKFKNIWLGRVDNEPDKFGIVISDVTEERTRSLETMNALHSALFAAEQASNAKTEFLSRMSHDIRTPLNAIIGYISMAKEDPSISQNVSGYLEKAESSTRFLLSLINDILNMSRIESGKMILKEEPFDLDAFIKEIAAMEHSAAELKQIAFSSTIDPKVKKYYVGDVLKIQQILLNIIGNAVKFTPSGGKVSLHVSGNIGNKNSGVRFEIEDTGCGISKEFLPYVFNAFEQENRTLDSEVKGTGLGLAICKSLTEMMNGRIYVTSQVGVGTKFTVDLPLLAAENAEQKTASAKNPVPKNLDFSGRHVLLVEDNAVNMEIAAHVLKNVNLIVDQAKNGREACDMFASSAPGYYSGIIMDIRMPVMNGNEAAKAIRAMVRSDSSIPIIAMSANAFDEDIREAISAGMNAYTIKPIDVPALYATLQEYLSPGTKSVL